MKNLKEKMKVQINKNNFYNNNNNNKLKMEYNHLK